MAFVYGYWKLYDSNTIIKSLKFEDDSKCTIIGDGAFDNASELINIQIPNSIIDIGSYAFQDSPVTTLSIDDKSSLEQIGQSAFQESVISSLNLPDSVKYIGDFAFDTASLSVLTLPKNVEYIGNDSFLILLYHY